MRVVLKKNIKDEGEIVLYNWDAWIVTSVNEKWATVLFDRIGEEKHIWYTKWEKKKYKWWRESVIWSYKQLPLVSWWAVTVHSSQGMTLDKMIFYPYKWRITKSFGKWLNYVWLSRIRDPKNLRIKF
jgi:hypothetical protein